MSLRHTFTWLAIAPLGLGLTTGVTITTTLLSQQAIGLSSEPLSAGDALAPRAATPKASGIRAHARHPAAVPVPHGGRATATAAPRTHPASVTPPAAAPTTPTPTTVQVQPPTTRPTPTQTEDHGGRDQRRSGAGGGNGRKQSDKSGSGARDD
jgi:hypothetical protein